MFISHLIRPPSLPSSPAVLALFLDLPLKYPLDLYGSRRLVTESGDCSCHWWLILDVPGRPGGSLRLLVLRKYSDLLGFFLFLEFGIRSSVVPLQTPLKEVFTFLSLSLHMEMLPPALVA